MEIDKSQGYSKEENKFRNGWVEAKHREMLKFNGKLIDGSELQSETTLSEGKRSALGKQQQNKRS